MRTDRLPVLLAILTAIVACGALAGVAAADPPDAPVESEAVDHLIALARSASPEDPIHVATIGAPTNVASALLVDPSIAPNLYVLFLAGYPTGASSQT